MNVVRFIIGAFLDLPKQFRLSYLPPLLVYLAAGISGLTAIVGTFFIKDYLNLSAAFLAGLGFWAGLPWALKMPLGHLVDLIWKHKNYMVYFWCLNNCSKFTNYAWIDRSYTNNGDDIAS